MRSKEQCTHNSGAAGGPIGLLQASGVLDRDLPYPAMLVPRRPPLLLVFGDQLQDVSLLERQVFRVLGHHQRESVEGTTK